MYWTFSDGRAPLKFDDEADFLGYGVVGQMEF